MGSNLYDSLPQGLKEVLDQMGESEAAKLIDAELAKQQARAYDKKNEGKRSSREI